MKFNRKPLLTFFTIVFVLLLFWDFLLNWFGTTTSVWNYLYNAGYSVLFLGAGWLGVRHARWFGLESTVGRALLFTGLGISSWGIGLWVWLYYNFAFGVEVPFPSVADIFFSLFYPLMIIGGWYFVKIFRNLLQRGIASSAIVYSTICTLIVFSIIFGAFINPVLSEPIPPLEKFFTVLYPVGDFLIILLALIAFWVSGGKIHQSLFLFIVGLLTLASADFLYVYRTARLTYWNGDVSDLLFTVGSFLFCLATIYTIDGLIPAPVEKKT